MFSSVVEAVFHWADAQPDKLCLADDNIRVTYAEYKALILRYACLFAENGVKAGDRVVVEACQTVPYLAIELALQALGAIFVPVEHNCAVEKIAGFADRAHAVGVITVRENAFDVEKRWTYAELEEALNASDAASFTLIGFPKAEDVSEILFSTGTTGREKGIVLTHGNDVALAENVIYGVEMEKDNVEMIPSPMNHSHGLRRYYANMVMGATVVLLGSVMNMKRFWANVDEFGVNSMDLVPTALAVVLKLSKDRFSLYRDRLRYIQFGAAPMMEENQRRICELLPDTRLYNFYGSTESGCISIYNFNRPDDKKHCIGKPTHNADIFVVDDERRPLVSSAEKTGLLASRGGMNMLGYWEDPEETARVLEDGVVYSNDVVYFDEDGEIILLGRRGDVINVGGNKVAPDEIENAVNQMPGIADSGVIPIPDKNKGHVPMLFVAMEAGVSFDPVAIRAFLAKSLEPYKVPAVIEQLPSMPRSFNGKLLRKELTGIWEGKK